MFLRVLLVLAAIAAVCLPAVSQAQSDIVITQDSCLAVANNHIRVYFTVHNNNPENMSACSFNLIPVPAPATEPCIVDDYGGEDLWVGSWRGDGGAWFGVPPTEYSYACLGANSSQGGFYITIEPGGGCCYEGVFANNYYENWATASWCVSDCIPVPTRNRSWGMIKSLYD